METAPGKVQKAICILGVHRSGTSVVARAINLMGAYLGEEEDFLPSGPDNAEGFWERKDVVDLHDRIMTAYSRFWHTALPLPNQWEHSEKIKPFRDELLKLIDKNFSGHQLWAWKDPRTSVLLPLWKDVLRDLGIQLSCVYVVRNPLEVANSIQKRHGLPYEKSFGLWFYNNITALQTCFSVPCVLISYEKFLNDWEAELRRCSSRLEISWPADELAFRKKMNESVRPELRHSCLTMNDLEKSGVPQPVRELYKLLTNTGEGSSLYEGAFKDVVSRLSTEFSSFASFFQYDMIQLWDLTQNRAINNHQLANLQDRLKAQQQIQDQLQETLNRIQSTLVWRLLKISEKFKSIFLPIHTRRRKIYDLILKNIKTIINEGWSVFLNSLKLKTIYRDLADEDSYKLWILKNEPNKAQLKTMRIEAQSWPYRPKISIITPVYNPSKYDVTECIKSVMNQVYDNWELCIADGSSDRALSKEIIQRFASNEPRIKVVTLSENLGIAGNSNEALKLVIGEYVGFLDHDDVLAPFALYEVVKLFNQDPTTDFIYSDEDKVVANGTKRYLPFFKPEWSPDTFLSYNYLCHFSLVRRQIIEDIGKFREGYNGSQDYDLILRIIQKTTRIKRISKILYHWRASETSASFDMRLKSYAIPAAKKAIADYLKNQGLEAEVLDGFALGAYRVKYRVRPMQKVSIIIPTKDKHQLLTNCVSSILEKTDYKNYEIVIVDNQSKEPETYDFLRKSKQDSRIKVIRYDQPFNFSAINNFAVRSTDSDYIVFLNNDTEVIGSEWLTAMLEFAQREDVGAVGAKLYYPNNTIQHGGIILGVAGVANHAHLHFPGSSQGYMGRLKIIHNVSAVTGACMMVRRKVFEKVGGFDEKLSHAFNDVDFCLKLRERGYLIVFTSYAELYHHESASRGYENTPERRARFLREEDILYARWKHILDAGDPYYNPNLTLKKQDFSIKI